MTDTEPRTDREFIAALAFQVVMIIGMLQMAAVAIVGIAIDDLSVQLLGAVLALYCMSLFLALSEDGLWRRLWGLVVNYNHPPLHDDKRGETIA